jgi:suppressor for copper-sensitivity B
MTNKALKFNVFALAFLALAGILAEPRAGLAAASGWAEEAQARVRLISAAQSLAGDEAALGLEFDLQPGWKIYWRSPGDAGLPPRIDWAGSQNLQQAEVAWPVPHRFSLFGLETFGYGGQIVLPIDARAAQPGQPLLLRAKVDYLICEEICIPYTAELALDLPPGEGARAPQAFLIESFRGQVPGQGAERGLEITSVGLVGSLEAPELRVTARAERSFAAPDLLVEAPPGFFFGPPRVALDAEGREAELVAAVTQATPGKVLEGKPVTVTVTDGSRGIEAESLLRYASPPAPPATEPLVLAGILGLALLGGLILNLMPCVLPVLSIKLLSVVEQGGRARAAVRASFLASAAGILSSFLVLAGLAVALKAGGLAVGWGIQFQQPLFLSAMALVMALFAYNLLGFFEVPLPGLVGRLAARQGGEAGGQSLWANFGAGALATLLATPCSAPFLGTSVGFALSRGAVEIFLIFTALGVGLALPYLLVAALLLGLGFVLWARPRLMADTSRGPRLAASALATLLAMAAIGLPAGFSGSGSLRPAALSGDSLAWQPLDREAIAGLVAQGRVVFVDVTADWCITCQVNKKLVLDDSDVRARLDGAGVVRMRGDWTLPSDEISGYLQSFGRYGIPFNAVYGPGAPRGLALPELLSEEAVLDAMARAAGG